MSAMAAACAGPVTAPRSQACTAPMKRRAPRRDPTRGSVDVVHRDRREQLRTSYRREATATRGDKAGGGESRHGRRPGGPPNPHRHERDHEGHPPGGEHPTGGATKKNPTHRGTPTPRERAIRPRSHTPSRQRHPAQGEGHPTREPNPHRRKTPDRRTRQRRERRGGPPSWGPEPPYVGKITCSLRFYKILACRRSGRVFQS